MKCLYCGNCCLTLSPYGSPCPKLEQRSSFYFCSDYQNKPKQCKEHQYPFSICPTGQKILNISSPEQTHERIDAGYALLKFNMNNAEEAYNELLNTDEND